MRKQLFVFLITLSLCFLFSSNKTFAGNTDDFWITSYTSNYLNIKAPFWFDSEPPCNTDPSYTFVINSVTGQRASNVFSCNLNRAYLTNPLPDGTYYLRMVLNEANGFGHLYYSHDFDVINGESSKGDIYDYPFFLFSPHYPTFTVDSFDGSTAKWSDVSILCNYEDSALTSRDGVQYYKFYCPDDHTAIIRDPYFGFTLPVPEGDYAIFFGRDGGYHSQVFHYCLQPTPHICPAPVMNAIPNTYVNNGTNYTFTDTFVDNDQYSTSWTGTVDYGDGSGAQPLTISGKTFSLNHLYPNVGPYDVQVTITNNQGASKIRLAAVTVVNPTLSVGSISVSSDLIQLTTTTMTSSTFSDSDTGDTHTAIWYWGDGSSSMCPTNSSTCTLTETNGSGTVSASHTYAATGVYPVTLKIIDNNGQKATAIYQYISVYDASSSFDGGRSFSNPSNALPNTSGKVMFGISAKYTNNNVLTGSFKMNFKAGNIDFASTRLQTLTTSNGKAYLTGPGTLNGSSNYTFLVTGIDGSVTGGQDTIRVKIKDNTNTVIYDSQPGSNDTADPTTQTATGNIRIH